jgi:flagellar P-ring protein precursor FlgI
MAMTRKRASRLSRIGILTAGFVLSSAALAISDASGQEARIQDLTVANQDVPVRLVGYGLVVGLDGTGDRVIGGFSSGHTVRSVANLLRRFDVEVPEQLLRTRNVAAVLVTAEVSPYLRPGGRFELHVSSVGDAGSLRGGVLWITPLVAGPSAAPVATAQGSLLLSEATDGFRNDLYAVETTARIPDGGILERALATPDFAQTSVLYLRNPSLPTATRIAEAINAELGDGTAQVMDPGAVNLQLTGDASDDRAIALAQIGQISVSPQRVARVIIDGRNGTVVAGGNMVVGEAVVSHGSMTLVVGGEQPDPNAPAIPGDVRMEEGVSVQDVAAALHAVAAPPSAIGAVFESLREVGAIQAEVLVR